MAALAYDEHDDYVAFCGGLQKLTKLDLTQYKRGQMERRLRTFAERRGVPDLVAYLAVVQKDAAELEQLLDRLTINVSQLWRNPEQWSLLGKHVVPELAGAGGIRIWSAGCSYGAEAYTIAGVCLETAPSVRLKIKGTDIDPRMIDRARNGFFSEDDGRTVPPASLERWFDRGDGGYRAKAQLRALVAFEQGDLLGMRFPAEAYDLVLCRNTVIYFNEGVRDELHAKLASTIRPGGYLVVGSTERVSVAQQHGLTLVHPFTYRKAR
jgi:chemotaxis protein methyltransferase CheR